MVTVRIDPRAGKLVREGHPWVFSNNVRAVEGGAAEPGEVVRVVQGEAGADRFVGTAFFNPRPLIALRLLSPDEVVPDEAFLATRLEKAAALRRRLFPESDAWRLCHGEADGLPGLLVDRYADVFAVQAVSAGMDRLLPAVATVLKERHGARSVVHRGDSAAREQEGLPEVTAVLAGEAPGPVMVSVPPLRLRVDVMSGQKTGAFLDQRENQAAAARHAAGVRVLDAFCHAGGFALHAALAGATEVVGVDSSGPALAEAREAAERHGVAATCRFEEADAQEYMDRRHARRDHFGLVILDPPSFTRSRKHVPAARRALEKLNHRALTLVEPGGVLVTSCCSHHVTEETFLALVQSAALSAGRTLVMLEQRSQSPDHPWLPAMPLGRYLKCVIARVL